VDLIRFTDDKTRHEIWELLDAGWEDWAAPVDQFLAHAVGSIAAVYAGDSVEWLEINYWRNSGRLIVFPSQDGPFGDRGERVCFELSSKHMEAESPRIGRLVPEAEQDGAMETLASRVWLQVSECLTRGQAARELVAARRSHKLRISGYDDQPGEGPFRLAESRAIASP